MKLSDIEYRKLLPLLMGILLAFVLIIISIERACRTNKIIQISNPLWQGILLGKTKSEEALELLGKPIRQNEYLLNGRLYYDWHYLNPLGNEESFGYEEYTNFVTIDRQCNCVVSMTEFIDRKEGSMSKEKLKEILGKPNIIIRQPFHMRAEFLVYTAEGVAFIVDFVPPSAISNVFARKFFLPMTLSEYNDIWAP